MKCEIQDPEKREQGKKQNQSSGLQDCKLGLFKHLLGRIPWDTVLKNKCFQESSMIAKDQVFQAQKLSISMFRRPKKG